MLNRFNLVEILHIWQWIKHLHHVQKWLQEYFLKKRKNGLEKKTTKKNKNKPSGRWWASSVHSSSHWRRQGKSRAKWRGRKKNVSVFDHALDQYWPQTSLITTHSLSLWRHKSSLQRHQLPFFPPSSSYWNSDVGEVEQRQTFGSVCNCNCSFSSNSKRQTLLGFSSCPLLSFFLFAASIM